MINTFDSDKQLNILSYKVDKLESRVAQLEAELYNLQIQSHTAVSRADFDIECQKIDELEMYMDKIKRVFN